MMAKNVFLKNASKRATLGLMGLSMAGMLLSCNAHPVSFSQSEGSVVINQDRSPGSAASVDILWMIDNSGSMCEIQTSIRDNFLAFIDQITTQNIDFQMGVTTTHFSNISANGEVARPGYLQGIPQPVPTSISTELGGTCLGDKGDPSNPTDGYQLVRTNIEIAIACTKNPEQWANLVNVTDEEIRFAYFGEEDSLDPHIPLQHTLFPTTPDGKQPQVETPAEDNPYRAIRGDNPLVLRSENYRDAQTGQLDIEALKADFGCMSLVGTLGDGYEKGLAGAIHAISPEMTGGPVENPLPTGEQAPNHGLIRENANFALVMVTDENDCTDYGAFGGDTAVPNTTPFYDEVGNVISRFVDIRSSCSATACAMWNDPALADVTPLIDTEILATRFKKNLAASKGKEAINENTIVVTSIHGESLRYGESYPKASDIDASVSTAPELDQETIRENIEKYLLNPNSCDHSILNPNYSVLAENISCTIADDNTGSSTVRVAWSGDRYQSFLSHFAEETVLPKDPTGLICDPASMGATLGEIGKLIAGSAAQCIGEPPHECVVDEDCPAFAFGDQEPSCLQFGRSNRKYCDSGMQLRIYPGEGEAARTFADLQTNPYCIPESIDSEMTPGGCVVDRSRFEVTECVAREEGMNIAWVEEDSLQVLGGYNVQLVYSVIPEPTAEGTDPAGADAAP